MKSCGKNQTNSMCINKKMESEPTKIAEGFNSFFSSIGLDLHSKISTINADYSKYLTNPIDANFLFRSADTEEILRVIFSFQNSKASGPNSIPTEILKMLSFNLCHPLKEIINISFATGIYPDKLKIAKVIPIFKNKGDQLLVSNYRPISLLSNINKIFEKLVHARLYSFLELHNCIFELQFGFRSEHSTNHALLSLTETIRNALDNSNFAGGIFVDLQKAFDTVDHEILLKKLEHYGVKGVANKWFKSYLTNRQQYVSINGFDSKNLPMNIGVPQGSVLGPLLFLIYINDLHKAIRYSIVHHFADDTNLLYINKNLKKLERKMNKDLFSLCTWLRANKISLNASKTELIIFRDPRKKITNDLKFKINGKKLVPCKSVKYLGVFIDCFLNWSTHLTSLSKKLSRAAGMLSKIRHYVDWNTLHMVYFGIFSSIMSYGSQIWGQLNNITKKVQVLQNKALRIMHFQPPRTSATPLFKISEILKITDLVSLQNFLFAYDSLNSNLPLPLRGKLNFLNRENQITRNLGYLQLSRRRTKTVTYGTKSIYSKSVDVWNCINRSNYTKVLHEKSRNVCKNFVKQIIIDKY